MRESVEQVEVAPDLLDYVVSIVTATREHAELMTPLPPMNKTLSFAILLR